MTKFYQTDKFKKLNEKWAEKLEKSGFEDIESNEDNLKEWDTSIFSRYDQHTIGAKEEYFRLAGQFLNTHSFKDKKEKLIWELHSEGHSFDTIASRLKSKRYRVKSRSSVHIIVKTLVEEMFAQNGIKQKRSNIN